MIDPIGPFFDQNSNKYLIESYQENSGTDFRWQSFDRTDWFDNSDMPEKHHFFTLTEAEFALQTLLAQDPIPSMPLVYRIVEVVGGKHIEVKAPIRHDKVFSRTRFY